MDPQIDHAFLGETMFLRVVIAPEPFVSAVAINTQSLNTQIIGNLIGWIWRGIDSGRQQQSDSGR